MGSYTPHIELAFDVGHSSIGWAVIKSSGNKQAAIDILGCGAVIFGEDDCLASKRRHYRRQRRHIRATRLRISRLKQLVAHLDVLGSDKLNAAGCAWPWLLAARVLRNGNLLTWEELWDVLRWYAHNRGYDGNRAWSRQGVNGSEDAEKVQNARELYSKWGTQTMAETFCAISGLDPLGTKRSGNSQGDQRPKGLNAAFPREDVEAEVRCILERHQGKLKGVDHQFINALFDDWSAIPCPALTLPNRYGRRQANGSLRNAGLLFGQLTPRFENRIISTCPIMLERVYQRVLSETGDPAQACLAAQKVSKVPSRECLDFYRFRWAMLLANVKVGPGRGRDTRCLLGDERRTLNKRMLEQGFLTVAEFKKAVRELVGKDGDNLDQMLIHPDAQETLLIDPVRKLLNSGPSALIWPMLSERTRKRTVGQLRRGRRLTIKELVATCDDPTSERIKETLEAHVDKENSKKRRKDRRSDLNDLMTEPLKVRRLSGRAPYSREVLQEAWSDVMHKGIHPKEEGGCLFRDEAIRQTQLQRAIDEQTNNHLVRHRLRILERLHADILKDYADNTPDRIARVTIEVNRELRELSGKTRKEQEQELGFRLANFRFVVKKLEKAFAGKDIKITPGLIRKARIAEDLGWTCPYTGKTYDAFDLLHRRVDKDHIIPRSDRASDSLDSSVITFAEVTKMKGKRTALRFIEEFQQKPVEGARDLHVLTLKQYQDFISKLETFTGHNDDKRRKKRRRELLQLRDYVEKDFTPGDLTRTSQLVSLGVQVLARNYNRSPHAPVIASIPGSVTGAVRKGWNVLGCLSKANPGVLDEDGSVRTKTEIRGITHLHHALDACVLALAAHFIPNTGRIWELVARREGSLNSAERRELAALGVYTRDSEGRFHLLDLDPGLKDQICHRLAEGRVVQHVPSDMTGMAADQTVWRVYDPRDGHPSAVRLGRWLQKAGVTVPGADSKTVIIVCRKRRSEPGADSGKTLHETSTWRWVYQVIAKSKVIGLEPRPGSECRLKRLKAVKILSNNYGLALDPEPKIIRHHKVYPQLRRIRNRNKGKWPRILRKGQLIYVEKGRYAGHWRVFSTKDSRRGLALDMGRADVVRLRNRTEGHKINVLVTTLLEDGVRLAGARYTGLASSPPTSSA